MLTLSYFRVACKSNRLGIRTSRGGTHRGGGRDQQKLIDAAAARLLPGRTLLVHVYIMASACPYLGVSWGSALRGSLQAGSPTGRRHRMWVARNVSEKKQPRLGPRRGFAVLVLVLAA